MNPNEHLGPPVTMAKQFLIIGGIAALLGVMMGAFGAHSLKKSLSADLMSAFETAVQYHFYHALGLLIVGLLAYRFPESTYLRWSGWLMVAGMVLFSGSLYALAVSGIRWLGAITPVGGTALIAAWAMLIAALLKTP